MKRLWCLLPPSKISMRSNNIFYIDSVTLCHKTDAAMVDVMPSRTQRVTMEQHAGQLTNQQQQALQGYLKQRFKINAKTLSAKNAAAYHRAQHLIDTEAADALAEESQIPERDRRAQRTFLRKLERDLPKRSAKVSRWAGLLADDDWQALLTYAKLRYGLSIDS